MSQTAPMIAYRNELGDNSCAPTAFSRIGVLQANAAVKYERAVCLGFFDAVDEPGFPERRNVSAS